ncbi:hypothetical protein AALA78_03570 [Lachnospiraceae bacterium 42-17]|jgi:hypothetical protein|nr:hypothetical protein [Dorea sp.]
MSRKLIIDGSAVYEVDEDCMLKRRRTEDEKEIQERNIYMDEYKKAMRRTE